MIGLDTGALIDLLRQNSALKKVIEDTEESLASTIINYQELMFGLDFDNPNHVEEEKTYSALFQNVHLLPFTLLAAKNASILFRALQKKGMDIGRFDSMIAGIFLEQGVTKIITRNTKHFQRMKEIEVLSY